MKALLLPLLLAILLAACERKPTEEELETQRLEQAARNKPTPKPGDWMWKERKDPLQDKAHK